MTETMGKAEQLDFCESESGKEEQPAVPPESDRAAFGFTAMREATGGEAPPRDGLELEQTSEQRKHNETITARRKFAGKG